MIIPKNCGILHLFKWDSKIGFWGILEYLQEAWLLIQLLCPSEVNNESLHHKLKISISVLFRTVCNDVEMTSTELRQREQDRERTKRSWEMAERQADEQREKERESVIRQQEEMSSRMRLQEDELMRRQQENTLFMKVGTKTQHFSHPVTDYPLTILILFWSLYSHRIA